MKKEYKNPDLIIMEYDVINNLTSLSNGGTMGGVGSENGGDSTDWNDE